MRKYSSGIFKGTLTYPCKGDPNYWMVIVGYGTDAK
jgi:hypothetical protein